MINVASGWHTHVGILVDILNGREPPGFWSTHARLEAEYGRRHARPGLSERSAATEARDL